MAWRRFKRAQFQPAATVQKEDRAVTGKVQASNLMNYGFLMKIYVCSPHKNPGARSKRWAMSPSCGYLNENRASRKPQPARTTVPTSSSPSAISKAISRSANPWSRNPSAGGDIARLRGVRLGDRAQ